ncbi:MAG: hydrogenase maturation protease [Bacteroidota bacterium]|jgi:hydrogenase maturation protease|nr:hydrogenase maturation protease [Bacteroidota bacterium]
MEQPRRILLIGYGNPGRLDDGLGPALAAMAETWTRDGLTVDADYQLTVEDANDVAMHEIVIFADASVNGPEPYHVEPVEPRQALSFSSHSVEPSALLHMAHSLFRSTTRGYILGIRGYEFNEFGEGLSPRAAENLAHAAEFLRRALEDPRLLDMPRAVR